jgi:adenylate cyclase
MAGATQERRLETDSPRILIVDDNEDNRYTLLVMLQTEGYTAISEASGGAEAIALLQRQDYDLLLLDLMMPDVTGDAVLRIIKANPATRDIPVIMLSADIDSSSISKCIELGADDYLTKPFNPMILRARIASALRRRSLRVLEEAYTSKIERQKHETESLLRNILPSEIGARLRAGETNIADTFESAVVVFSDIVGFTAITARMKAYEIVACLNILFSEFDKLAEQHGLEKIRTMGDSYMAVAGIPWPRSGYIRDAALFALGIVDSIRHLEPRLPVPFSIRVGAHKGPLMAGVIGCRKFAYDVWGDTVNVAARLEQASEANRVLISSDLAEALKGEFELDGPRTVVTKENREIRTFFLQRVAAGIHRSSG